eukprot:9572878-Alexandrium_andersonii.AAC.1
MSASLVGSEMCIRDRPWTCHCGMMHWLGSEKCRRKGCDGARSDAQATPVSYTHLTLPTICSV